MVNAALSLVILSPMTSADLESVLKLRNHPQIRRYMLTQHEISIEEHTSWFNLASQNPGIALLVLKINDETCGFVQFKETSYRGVVDWGFYASADAPKGTGRKLGLAAINHAFKNENLHKICGQALHWNQASIEFHKSLGFVQEGVLRNQHYDSAGYHNMICFGLLKHEWIGKESLTGINK
jgi:UDP-4-amino-4,6-dideoxy-N-acetyl-beta-L-altrosamine N-acetyltransferase